MELGLAEIKVCEKPCVTDETASTADVYACQVPSISTVKSNSEFLIQEESNLTGERQIYSGITRTNAKRVIDGSVLPSIDSSSAGCYVGIQFPTGYVGVLNEISFFLDEFSQGNIVDQLKIQASDDNFSSSIIDLVLVSEEAHEGWNYYSMSDLDDASITEVKHQYYRLYSGVSSGCNAIGEIHFYGVEVIDDDNDTYDCDVTLIEYALDSTETSTDLAMTVTYDVTQTPVIDEISPRYGAVNRDTLVTITGRNFLSADTSHYSITLDNIECLIVSVSSTEVQCTA